MGMGYIDSSDIFSILFHTGLSIMLLKKCCLNRVICVKRTLYISSVNYIRPQLSDENKVLMKKGRDYYYRLLDGMPAAEKAPHLKIIYSSSLKYVPYVYNPISILWTPCMASLTVFSNSDKLLVRSFTLHCKLQKKRMLHL